MRRLPRPQDGLGRVEDGAIQFGDDWPGTFLRGDTSRGYAVYIGALFEEYPDIPTFPGDQLRELRDLLNECWQGTAEASGKG